VALSDHIDSTTKSYLWLSGINDEFEIGLGRDLVMARIDEAEKSARVWSEEARP
jgi:hypothetical protein